MADTHFRFDTVVAAAVGGAAGGLLVWALIPGPPRAVEVAADAPPVSTQAAARQDDPSGSNGASAGTGDDKERLERLEALVGRLQRSQAAQAKLEAYSEGEGGQTASGESEIPGERITLSAADPRFEQAVRTVMDQARVDQREQRREDRITRQVDYLADKLQLSEQQAEKVDDILYAQANAIRDLRESDDRPVTRSQWREKMAAFREETKTKLAEVLNADQLEGYDKLQEEEGFNSGRRGR